MEIHQKFPATALDMGRALWRNRSLLYRLVVREVVGRYRGSFFGLAWSFFNPLLMLVIYTVVFSMVFEAKWSEQAQHPVGFSLVLFVGMILHGFLSECITRSPSVILSNANYVKKVVFPLEILPVAALGSAFFHACISLGVLLGMFVALHGLPPPSIIIVPILLIPLILSALGASWLLASLGVYVRDVGQIASVLSTILLFLSPVFYSASAVPPGMRWIFRINPLAITIGQMRGAFLWGQWPDWRTLAIHCLSSLLFAWLGFAWFQKTRTGFADVL
jgi:lipopolysaccharide transport system permease protein